MPSLTALDEMVELHKTRPTLSSLASVFDAQDALPFLNGLHPRCGLCGLRPMR